MIVTQIKYILTCNLCTFRMEFPEKAESGNSGLAVAEQTQKSHMEFHQTLQKNVRVLVPEIIVGPPFLEGVITDLYFDREQLVVALKGFQSAWHGTMRSIILDRRKA